MRIFSIFFQSPYDVAGGNRCYKSLAEAQQAIEDDLRRPLDWVEGPLGESWRAITTIGKFTIKSSILQNGG